MVVWYNKDLNKQWKSINAITNNTDQQQICCLNLFYLLSDTFDMLNLKSLLFLLNQVKIFYVLLHVFFFTFLFCFHMYRYFLFIWSKILYFFK